MIGMHACLAMPRGDLINVTRGLSHACCMQSWPPRFCHVSVQVSESRRVAVEVLSRTGHPSAQIPDRCWLLEHVQGEGALDDFIQIS